MFRVKAFLGLGLLGLSMCVQAEGPGFVPPVSHPVQDRVMYFVLPDRFENANPLNDQGGLGGDALTHGYAPTQPGYFHGGDLAGLTQRLDYLKALGISAIWMTPIAQNQPVQGDGTLQGSSAGYHGYWVTDFMKVDPHLGDEADLKALIAAAHSKGIQIYFDIIVNHTADIIHYGTQTPVYRSKASAPYKNAQGEAFDEATWAGKAGFPALDATKSFPYVPQFRDPVHAKLKNPDWLNNLIYYHNRGDSFFEGESNTLGDFAGLDDLFTEHPKVIQGVIDIYTFWLNQYEMDGFRVDTVKHVDMPFWKTFSPAIFKAAQAAGHSNFFMFGEVYDHSPSVMSRYSTQGGLSATLDFGFQRAVKAYVTGQGSASDLRDLFEEDDYYTAPTRNAYSLPTFLGNHDMGRIGHFVQRANPRDDGKTLLARSSLAHALLFFARGVPVIYYGDEQGMTGEGGDKAARQDMFKTQVPSYAAETPIGGQAGAQSHFDTKHPLFELIQNLAKTRQAHTALRRGAQFHRYASRGAGIYAFSRIDREEQREYIVLTNSHPEAQTARFASFTPKAKFEAIWGATGPLQSDDKGELEISVPGLSALVYRADKTLPALAEPPGLKLHAPFQTPDKRLLISADLNRPQWAEVSFEVKQGEGDFEHIGTATRPPYRVFWQSPGTEAPTPLSIRATARDAQGRQTSVEHKE